MSILDLLRGKKTDDILARDITGECQGACRDRVREGELARQDEMKQYAVEDIDEYPGAAWAQTRNDPPGAWGGHV